MKKWFAAIAALVALGFPAAYAAAPDKEKPKPATAARSQSSDDNGAKTCKAERGSLGAGAFRKKYGTNHNLRNAFGKCVSAKSKDDDKEDGDDGDGKSGGGAKVCKAKRASMGADAFAKKYGTNHNLKNAFGKCVSSKAKGKAKDKDDEDGAEKDDD
jgi:hypothetical protein